MCAASQRTPGSRIGSVDSATRGSRVRTLTEFFIQRSRLALAHPRREVVAKYLRNVPTDRLHRKGLHAIANALAPTPPSKPHRSPRKKNERTPRHDIGKRILDQIDAGLSATAAIKSAMEEFNIARRTAYSALSSARELRQCKWRSELAALPHEHAAILTECAA
jgi:hypothetical protein